MQKLIPISSFALAVALTACAHLRAPQEACTGSITKIEEQPGEHYFPAKGREPLTRVFVRANHGGDKGAADLLQILVSGLYNPSIYGHAGDTVHFICARHSLQTGTVWIEAIEEYKIIPPKR